uniref:CREG-like beta-barrel domain-containing protein n=1 Tax=Chlamydomonas euryale TaxID=1486919 RepID=A0A7R9V107_9CHLO|mmetsp:Transcript_13476/g.39055  ORF Transcript_13476/g.39055 Transcript_13476/m.39055 type:complete len:383 (+) Transcript_13476:1-1149(+)
MGGSGSGGGGGGVTPSPTQLPQAAHPPTPLALSSTGSAKLRKAGPGGPAAAAAARGEPEFDPARCFQTFDDPTAGAAQKAAGLDLAYESAAKPSDAALHATGKKSTGLHRAPLSGGVRTATDRYMLPKPAVAVRNLVEIARYGHLCTTMCGMHHRRAGYPFGTLVDFAVDGGGYPVFCLSTLAIHSRNLLEDSRCSFVVQMPGWTGLANARVTIFGDCSLLPLELQDAAKDVFAAKDAGASNYRSSNFVFFRMNRITDIYFVGGFGTVQWLEPEEYLSSSPDQIVTCEHPSKTLQSLTEQFSKELIELLCVKTGESVSEVIFISMDAHGADVRLRCAHEFNVERLAFAREVSTPDEARAAVGAAVKRLREALGGGAAATGRA